MKRIVLYSISCLLLLTGSAVAQGPVAAQGVLGDAYGGAGSVTSGVATATGSGSPTTVSGSPTTTQGSGVAGDSVEATSGETVAPTGVSSVANAAAAAEANDLRGDSLPFTGFDVLLMFTGAAVLLIAGMGMRRLSRRPI